MCRELLDVIPVGESRSVMLRFLDTVGDGRLEPQEVSLQDPLLGYTVLAFVP